MSTQKIVEVIANIIVEKLNLSRDIPITAETGIIELGLDSIAMMTLWVYLEDHYGFEADEDVIVGAVSKPSALLPHMFPQRLNHKLQVWRRRQKNKLIKPKRGAPWYLQTRALFVGRKQLKPKKVYSWAK